jgi:AAA domain
MNTGLTGDTDPPSDDRESQTRPGTTWVEDVRKEPVRWAIPDYIPRRVVSSIYGPRNSGKTTLAVWLATEAARQSGLRVWLNSREDDLPTVLKARFDAGGADLTKQHIRLTGNAWRLPGDLGKIRDELTLNRAAGFPNDMLILDSIQQHIDRPYAHTPAQATIQGLLKLAIDFDMAMVLVGHTTKGKHASVEAMLAGAAVLQNMSKAIYVYGPAPVRALLAPGDDEDANPRYVLACERLGIAPKPVSKEFELMLAHDQVTGRDEPYLLYVGPSSATAREVIDRSKTDDRGGEDASKTAQTSLWIADVLSAAGPMPTKDFEAQAKGDGAWNSRNTFDRARKLAGVETHKRGSQWWVCLAGQWEDE